MWRAQLVAVRSRSGDGCQMFGTGARGPCCRCLLMLVLMLGNFVCANFSVAMLLVV